MKILVVLEQRTRELAKFIFRKVKTFSPCYTLRRNLLYGKIKSKTEKSEKQKKNLKFIPYPYILFLVWNILARVWFFAHFLFSFLWRWMSGKKLFSIFPSGWHGTYRNCREIYRSVVKFQFGVRVNHMLGNSEKFEFMQILVVEGPIRILYCVWQRRRCIRDGNTKLLLSEIMWLHLKFLELNLNVNKQLQWINGLYL